MTIGSKAAPALAAAALVFACGGTVGNDAGRSAPTPGAGGPEGALPPATNTAVLVVDILAGQGAVRVQGISAGRAITMGCVAHCELRFDEGSAANVTAEPLEGWLVEALGGVCTGSGTCSVQLGARQAVTARFKLAPPPPPRENALYDAVDVSRLGGPSSVTDAAVLDDAGAVAGRICDSPPLCSSLTWDVFLWDGTLHRFQVPQGARASVAATAAGRVAGTLEDAEGASRAFITAGRDLVELDTLGGNSFVSAINAPGVVVGASFTPSGEKHAVAWKDGRLVDLGARTGKAESVALAIDDSGRVGVVACDRLEPQSGCRGMVVTGAEALDVGALPDAFYPRAMSAQGQVVGFVLGYPQHAVTWTAGETIDLDGQIAALPWPSLGLQAGGRLGSTLQAVAASGDAVGAVDIPISEGGAATAILWKDGKVVDLQAAVDPPTHLHAAFAINAKGQILARRGEYGFAKVLLTPR
jgi:probable HAF family extracellular repeat protein